MSGGRSWSAEDDALLREMIEAGREYRSIARTLKRSISACRCHASALRFKLDPSAVLANRKRGRDRFNNNPRKSARRIERLLASYTPLDRKIRAEELRQRNKSGVTGLKGRHHSADSRRKISSANKGKPKSLETRQRMSEAAKRRWSEWRANRPEQLARRVMLADREHLKAFGEWGVPIATEADLIWCGQCELRVSAERARGCVSPFCKAKVKAA